MLLLPLLSIYMVRRLFFYLYKCVYLEIIPSKISLVQAAIANNFTDADADGVVSVNENINGANVVQGHIVDGIHDLIIQSSGMVHTVWSLL